MVFGKAPTTLKCKREECTSGIDVGCPVSKAGKRAIMCYKIFRVKRRLTRERNGGKTKGHYETARNKIMRKNKNKTKQNKSKQSKSGRCIGKRDKRKFKTKIHLEHANSRLLNENRLVPIVISQREFMRVYELMDQAGDCMSE